MGMYDEILLENLYKFCISERISVKKTISLIKVINLS